MNTKMILLVVAALFSFSLASVSADVLRGRFVLYDADSKTAVRTLWDGDTLFLDELPPRFTVIFEPESPRIQSITFSLNEQPRIRHETARPFTLAGDSQGRYFPWRPRPGRYEIAATSDERYPSRTTIRLEIVEQTPLKARPPAGGSVRLTDEPIFYESIAMRPDLRDSLESRVRNFIKLHHARSEENDLEAIMALYAEPVDYYDRGLVNLDTIRADKRNYLQRWPVRKYVLEEMQLSDTDEPLRKRVVFSSRFSLQGRGQSSAGRTSNDFVLDVRDEEIRILAERSSIIPRKPDREEPIKSPSSTTRASLRTKPASDSTTSAVNKAPSVPAAAARVDTEKSDQPAIRPAQAPIEVSGSTTSPVKRAPAEPAEKTRVTDANSSQSAVQVAKAPVEVTASASLPREKPAIEEKLPPEFLPEQVVFPLEPAAGTKAGAQGKCFAILNKVSSNVELICSHTVQKPSGARLVESKKGKTICDLGAPASPVVKTCKLDEQGKAAFASGNLSVKVEAEESPEEALTGVLKPGSKKES